MSTPSLPRRSVFSDRLLQFRNFAFSDGAEFSRRGTWADYFRTRIGPAFTGEIVLDVGCHEGELLSAVSTQNPATAFIGLDWKPRSLFHAATKLQASPNVALLHARAQDLSRLFAPSELSELWLFHPEPCALPHELSHRLFNPPFLLAAHTALRPGGLFCLKTDHPGYFQHALALLGLPPPFAAAHSAVPAHPRPRTADLGPPAELPPPDPALTSGFLPTSIEPDFWSAQPSSRLFSPHTTTYEARFRRRKNPIHYLELQTLRPQI